MISKEQYLNALASKAEIENIILKYHAQIDEEYTKAKRENRVFKSYELTFSKNAKCACGAGLAYPREFEPFKKWNCSSYLLGRYKECKETCSQEPFSFLLIEVETKTKTTRRK